jgi:hypothetical protein
MAIDKTVVVFIAQILPARTGTRALGFSKGYAN